MHGAGKINPQSVRLLKAAKSTVRDAGMRYKELGTCSDRPRCGRPRTARTQSKIIVIMQRIRRNPKRGMRKLARSLEIDEKSVKTIVKKDLMLSPLKM